MNDLEKRLHQLKPILPGDELASRIAGVLNRPAVARKLSMPDRFLLATLSAGLVAACLIITFLTIDYSNNQTPPPPQTTADAPTANTQRILAQLMRE